MKIIECKKNIFVLDMKNTHYVVGLTTDAQWRAPLNYANNL